MKTSQNKKIIQRNLPLDVQYSLVKVSYLSLEDGGGCSCENCGKLITNIAHIKSANGTHYNIGLDCLDTLLENNSKLLNSEDYFHYLHSDKPAIQKAKSLRSKLLSNLKKEPTFEAKLYVKEGSETFGFSFSAEITRTMFVFPDNSREPVGGVEGNPVTERKTYRDPRGFDFTFRTEYKELTLNYLKGLTNVIY